MWSADMIVIGQRLLLGFFSQILMLIGATIANVEETSWNRRIIYIVCWIVPKDNNSMPMQIKRRKIFWVSLTQQINNKNLDTVWVELHDFFPSMAPTKLMPIVEKSRYTYKLICQVSLSLLYITPVWGVESCNAHQLSGLQ